MKRYESYKDSSVKWLGEIPGHWEVIRLKALLIERIEKNNNKENLIILSLLKDKGIIPYDEKGAIGNNSKEDLSQYKIARKGDLVINSMNVIIGSVGITQYDGYISPAYYSFKPRGIINLIYYYYLMTLRSVQQSIRCYSKGIMEIRLRITSNDFLFMPFPFPPKSEQTAIANYLDSVTSKIDKAISQQQKMIDLLNERKQIIIQNAVTKGLDPNAKMKDSGVEWIGEIPENWEVRRIKNSCKIINKKSTDNLPYIELDNIESKSGKLLSYSNNRPDSICNHFDKGDILFCKLRPYLAKCIITGVEGKCSSELLVLRHFLGDQKYFQYLLLSPKLIDLINESTYGAKMPRANWSYIGNCIIPIPSLEEQKSIINYLDSFTSYIDSSISQCNKMISLLQERKQIIINDSVIGKIKVV